MGGVPALVAPAVEVRDSFLSAVREMQQDGRPYYDGLDRDLLARPGQFATYVEQLAADALPGTPRAPGLVPQTTLWWVEGTQFLGRLSVRHELTDFLFRIGGHIGYDVRPVARRRGHATAMLQSALPVAHGLGIDPALVTCDLTNLASRRVIEAAGGVPAQTMGNKLRFWVPT
jgi:predicted acetyltransferase